jgi:hypothetical protein
MRSRGLRWAGLRVCCWRAWVLRTSPVFTGRSVGGCPGMFRSASRDMADDFRTSQPAKGAEIWIMCGNACAGKTTRARLLAQRLPPAAHVDGDEMQRLIVSGCRWPVPSDSDPSTGRLTGAAGVQYALRIRNACLVAPAFADAGITAIVTDSIINEGFGSLTEVLAGRLVNFVVLRPPVAVLRQRWSPANPCASGPFFSSSSSSRSRRCCSAGVYPPRCAYCPVCGGLLI